MKLNIGSAVGAASAAIPKRTVAFIALIGGLLTLTTYLNLAPIPATLTIQSGPTRHTDRFNTPLAVTYQTRWNSNDILLLHEIPVLLRQAIVRAEDKSFFSHNGVDWPARIAAIYQNLVAGHAVRGASTISEQVVRLHNDRPRTLWVRWLEGWEAQRLEQRFTKSEILAFYLNQVPYGRHRRGVAQAARLYFNRGLSTLNERELLTLATLIRAPGRWDLFKNPHAADPAMDRLAAMLRDSGELSNKQFHRIKDAQIETVAGNGLPYDATHFLQAARKDDTADAITQPRRTTLDGPLQHHVAGLLQQRLISLQRRHVQHAAALVLDHLRNEVLVWTSVGVEQPPAIDAVLTPRQPGSTLKPFLYALALERGWTAATIIDDSPLTQAVGTGAHSYRNYSQRFYGPLRLREALGNSLNIPAIRTMEFVGRKDLLQQLRKLGFTSLAAHPDQYGDGLALGNGEVSLYELVNAYAALARGGVTDTPKKLIDAAAVKEGARRTVPNDVARIISDILSDPRAREREFGGGTLLDFPVSTAVKTGTANNYTDAWAVGYNYRYTAGVWLGNLDRTPMKEVSGAMGPALVLRGIFAELTRDQDTQPLDNNRGFDTVTVCRITGHRAGERCPGTLELFRPGTAPKQPCRLHGDHIADAIDAAADYSQHGVSHIIMPTPGLVIAKDPRIPDDKERLPFQLNARDEVIETAWFVDGVHVATTRDSQWFWPLEAGRHEVSARVIGKKGGHAIDLKPVTFTVK